MLCRASQDGQVMVDHSDKTWSTEEGNGKPPQYFGHKNPINSMKRQKDVMPEDEPSRLEGVQYFTGEKWRAITNRSGKNEVAGPKQKQHSGVGVSSGESKVQCCKE